jgi:alkylated DNA repair protein (DNA oxidative demethylase)
MSNCSDDQGDLFAAQGPAIEKLGSDACVLRAFVRGAEATLLDRVHEIVAISPWRHLVTPGGSTMSVSMTNTGDLGWVSDRRGYRYDRIDPLTGQPWPHMPREFIELAERAAAAAGFNAFVPDACLLNRYVAGARLSLHCDQDEDDATAPIVSVSLGVTAKFIWGGLERSSAVRRLPLYSGDIVVWGGASRFVYHGIAPLRPVPHALTGAERINLTFRKAR